MYLLFWRKYWFFSLAYIEIFLRLQANHFWQCCQKGILRVHRIILRKNTFYRRKKCFFLNIFGLWALFPPIFQVFGEIVKTAFHVSKCFSRKFFLKMFFLLLLGMEQKYLVFCRRISGRDVKLHSTCPQELFEEQSLFREKVGFFSIFFEFWVNFFWRTRHNCMLRVQKLFGGK